MMIFVGHGLQYLWITTYYARASAPLARLCQLLGEGGRLGHRDLDAARGADRPERVRERARPRRGPVRGDRDVRQPAPLHPRRRDLEAAQHADRGRADPERARGESEAAPRSPWLRRPRVDAPRASASPRARSASPSPSSTCPTRSRAATSTAPSAASLLSRWLGSDEPALRDQLVEQFSERGDVARAALMPSASWSCAPTADLRAAGRGPSRARRTRSRAVGVRSRAREGRTAARPRARGPRDASRSQRGEDAVAAQHYSLGDRGCARSPTAIANDLAWLLATSSDPAVRNVDAATAAAEQLVKVDEKPHHLDTLAAAYAAGGPLRRRRAHGLARRGARRARERRGAARRHPPQSRPLPRAADRAR